MAHALKQLARYLTPKPWRKLLLSELIAALPAQEQEQLRITRDHAPKPFLLALPYTEGRLEWVALHAHCTRGQIDPSVLRQLKDIDLEFLAASPPPGEWYRLRTDDTSRERQQAVELEVAKLHANMTRATRELQRRYAVRVGATIAALSLLLGAATSRLS